MFFYNVLADGKTQSAAAGGFVSAFFRPVEPLEHSSLLVFGNADAGV